ncbi:hypothetical protein ABAC460_09720 [Asticcacaulis sp. AC460]|uniref:hypothetical protein n=1 Tax=Asticcacaulis sp. AC460 TaxID=1282360 RepID=UPI0003C3EDFF|nr:hypothetical protein [Asticcacaulis sp. AC460]ESQ90035.1 hypothetical protein ABAC460_09720 [Asticcacaulis sp. AC460]
MISKLFAGLLAVTALAAAPMAHADAGALKNIQVVDCRTHDEAQEKKDTELTLKALEAMNAGGVDRAWRLLPELEAALARAPDVPSLPERCGDTIHIYDDDMMLLLAMTAYVTSTPELKNVSVVQHEALPYGSLGFIVGWLYYEKKDFGAAHRAYAKGRLNNPDDYVLVAEDSLALAHMHRSREALDLLDAFIAGHPDLEDDELAALQRKRGYTLIELDRNDEAEAAYKESLRLEPDNSTAKAELDYITQQRKSSQPAN